jgi:DNA-binding NarL/FixJ family response regulator
LLWACKNCNGWQPESRKHGQERKNMLSQSQRTAILELHAQGVKKREIARVLGISRLTVRKVLRSNSTQVPVLQRAEKAEPLSATDPGVVAPLQRESCAGP